MHCFGMSRPPHFFRGKNPIEACTPKLHVHPELASGTSSIPLAGIMLIQQPGREIVLIG